MTESVTYQAIFRDGKAEEARDILLMLGSKRFGPPSGEAEMRLNQLKVDRLNELIARILDVESWAELLGG